MRCEMLTTTKNIIFSINDEHPSIDVLNEILLQFINRNQNVRVFELNSIITMSNVHFTANSIALIELMAYGQNPLICN